MSATSTPTRDEIYEMQLRARRYRLRHDSHFYGPMKDAACGCPECQLARDVITLASLILYEERQ